MARIADLTIDLSADDRKQRRVLRRARQDWQRYQRAVGAAALGAARSVTTAARNTSIAIGVSLAALAVASARSADEMLRVSRNAGIAFNEYQKLAFAARAAGAETETVAEAAISLADRLVDLKQGVQGVVDDFRLLGLTYADFEGRTQGEALQIFLTRLRNIGASTTSIAAASRIAGSDVEKLVGALTDAEGSFSRLNRLANVGGIFSEKSARSVRDLKTAFELLKTAVGARFLEGLTIGLNLDDSVDGTIKRVADGFGRIGVIVGAAIQYVANLGITLDEVVKIIKGGLVAALAAIGLVVLSTVTGSLLALASHAKRIGRIVTTLGKLSLTLTGITAAWKAITASVKATAASSAEALESTKKENEERRKAREEDKKDRQERSKQASRGTSKGGGGKRGGFTEFLKNFGIGLGGGAAATGGFFAFRQFMQDRKELQGMVENLARQNRLLDEYDEGAIDRKSVRNQRNKLIKAIDKAERKFYERLNKTGPITKSILRVTGLLGGTTASGVYGARLFDEPAFPVGDQKQGVVRRSLRFLGRAAGGPIVSSLLPSSLAGPLDSEIAPYGRGYIRGQATHVPRGAPGFSYPRPSRRQTEPVSRYSGYPRTVDPPPFRRNQEPVSRYSPPPPPLPHQYGAFSGRGGGFYTTRPRTAVRTPSEVALDRIVRTLQDIPGVGLAMSGASLAMDGGNAMMEAVNALRDIAGRAGGLDWNALLSERFAEYDGIPRDETGAPVRRIGAGQFRGRRIYIPGPGVGGFGTNPDYRSQPPEPGKLDPGELMTRTGRGLYGGVVDDPFFKRNTRNIGRDIVKGIGDGIRSADKIKDIGAFVRDSVIQGIRNRAASVVEDAGGKIMDQIVDGLFGEANEEGKQASGGFIGTIIDTFKSGFGTAEGETDGFFSGIAAKFKSAWQSISSGTGGFLSNLGGLFKTGFNAIAGLLTSSGASGSKLGNLFARAIGATIGYITGGPVGAVLGFAGFGGGGGGGRGLGGGNDAASAAVDASRTGGGPFQSGGIIQGRRGEALFVQAHAGEVVLNEQQQRRLLSGDIGGSSITINLTLDGDTTSRTRREMMNNARELAAIVRGEFQAQGLAIA